MDGGREKVRVETGEKQVGADGGWKVNLGQT